MEYSIVIKVKYGDTLRRFNARINENEQLELNMAALRARICGLFNLSPDVDLTLTYVDVDGDIVTLVDEDDLRDVMTQNLNPFRINVLLNNEKSTRSYSRSSGNSTPMTTPRVHPLSNINTGVAEVLKSAPEPLREALSKLSADLTSKVATSAPGLTNSGVAEVLKSAQEPLSEALSKLSADLTSKAMTSAPVLAELVECFSKMGLSYKNLGSQIQVGAESGSGTTETPMAVPVTENPKSAKNDAREVLRSTTPKVSSNSSKKDVFTVATPVIPTPVATPVIPASTYVDLNLDHLGNSTLVNAGPVAPSSLVGEKGKETGVCKGMSGSFYSPINAADSKKPCHPVPPVPFNECPFTGMPLPDESAFPFAGYPRVHPFKRSHTHGDFMAGIFHKGIRCDGCGVHPITGPRFKSTVKEDYDLCSICFAEMGNEADYIRLDRPVVSRHHKGLPFPFEQHAHPGARAIKAARKLNSRFGLDVNAPPVLRGCGLKAACKLNSRFVLDVNVMDGTLMAPLTPFTKIWRMRNNGTFAWPRGTQLLWIGGDKISGATSVEIEIPSAGVAVGRELDIAVDCIAPEKPGQYISYWRMASQSGQKFGQRIWVLVHVDASLKDSIHESEHGINLNLPPVNGVHKAPETEIFDMNVKLEDDTNIPGPSNTAANQIMVSVGEDGNKDQELNFPINDNLLVGDGVKNSVPMEVVPSVVSYPIIDLSEVPQVVPSMTPSPTVDVVTSSENDVEKNLLHELEEMGFKQVELNKEVLRMNEYNLEQSLDHLCGVAEWDPILEELDEMGFCDKEMNKKLLAKNNGSIKRVVMDLISGERA